MQREKTGQQNRRESLLQAAIEVFSERGYQGATMEEIARRAGVAKGTPYLHFSDKADLFYAVFERWVADILKASERAFASATTARERLLALLMSSVDYIEAHRELFPLTLEVWAASSTPALRKRFAAALKGLYADYRREAASVIRAGQAGHELRGDVDAEALAALLTGAVDGLFLQCWFDPALNARKFVLGFFDALMQGVSIPAEGGQS